jgi:hypothetical protein
MQKVVFFFKTKASSFYAHISTFSQFLEIKCLNTTGAKYLLDGSFKIFFVEIFRNGRFYFNTSFKKI